MTGVTVKRFSIQDEQCSLCFYDHVSAAAALAAFACDSAAAAARIGMSAQVESEMIESPDGETAMVSLDGRVHIAVPVGVVTSGDDFSIGRAA